MFPLDLTRLTTEQRAMLDHLSRYHQHGPLTHHVIKPWLVVIFLACCLAVCVGLVVFAEHLHPFYSALLCGFFAGSLFTSTRYQMSFQRQWPLFDAVIDWNLVNRLKGKSDVAGRS